ncbi:LysR family transcriptional regulator [Rhizorhabdus dicambivorans]|uniref:LysR family transcriptional regulator n=1 Tax=Rhizorhabdus dicambivorans TaxID=1850238 RepID=A0A2A4FY00_9SPHN|nr:LysR family transcriptional regulator [Rhizorhabdus dicambivorans]ATE64147.1 LysR family transcriptional regulator [Rhizorhabdus dicambivorans]PCE42582.1 LysR family transcriptional regulator [Rhizorhabdus dicambivorans]
MLKPFDLNLRHLRALGAVVAQRSLNRAAEEAGLSQPALTQGLGKLERQLGVLLFDRHSDGVTPTFAGTALADRAGRAFAQLATASRRPGRGAARGFSSPERLMTATQLEAFLHFADAQGFAGAAAASGLSQPAIHRAVRELEQICAMPLAERRGRGMVLTAAGRNMARGVRLAAGEIAAGIDEARGEPDEGGRITIGAMPLSRALVVPRALAHFLRDAPATVIDIVEGSWRELVDPLLDGVIDIMVGALREAPPAGVEQVPLFTDRLAIFGRKDHPLAARTATVADLRAQSWVVGPAGTPLRAHWEAMFEGEALPPVPVECGSVMVIRGLVMQSDLLTLLSPDQISVEIEASMLVRIGSNLPSRVRSIGISTRSGWRPTRGQQRMIDLLNQASIETRLQENQ